MGIKLPEFKLPIINTQRMWMTMMIISVMVLSCILFYVIAPHLRLTSHIAHPKEVAAKVIETTKVDVIVIWDMDTAMNNRTIMGFDVRNKDDTKIVQQIVDSLKDIRLSAAFGAEELHAIISAESMCSKTPTPTPSTAAVIKKYIQSHPNAYYCLIPVQDMSGAVSGLINVIWYEHPTDDVLSGTIAQAKHLVKSH